MSRYCLRRLQSSLHAVESFRQSLTWPCGALNDRRNTCTTRSALGFSVGTRVRSKVNARTASRSLQNATCCNDLVFAFSSCIDRNCCQRFGGDIS